MATEEGPSRPPGANLARRGRLLRASAAQRHTRRRFRAVEGGSSRSFGSDRVWMGHYAVERSGRNHSRTAQGLVWTAEQEAERVDQQLRRGDLDVEVFGTFNERTGQWHEVQRTIRGKIASGLRSLLRRAVGYGRRRHQRMDMDSTD